MKIKDFVDILVKKFDDGEIDYQLYSQLRSLVEDYGVLGAWEYLKDKPWHDICSQRDGYLVKRSRELILSISDVPVD